MGINLVNLTNKVNTTKFIVNLYNKQRAQLKIPLSL